MKTYRLPRYGLHQIISKDATEIVDNISIYVQEHGGKFFIRRHCIEFYVPNEYALFVKILYPFLEEVATI
jgi:hypothetical protein